jgi:uncharacterized protein
MLSSTFSIFPGIGPRLERYLWRTGVLTWEHFLASEKIAGFSCHRKALLDGYVLDALSALRAGNILYFQPLLGPGGFWRLWDLLGEDALCMDIETDGKNAESGEVTVVGFYSNGEYRPYVLGRNLNKDDIQREIEDSKLLVTFAGSTFDIPYLKAFYPGLRVDVPHLDLCPAGHKAGLKGGLKKVEKLVGIARPDEVEGIGGYQAVLLWQAHMRGRDGALDTLIAYNREDTENLHVLASKIYDMLFSVSGLPEFASGGPFKSL